MHADAFEYIQWSSVEILLHTRKIFLNLNEEIFVH
jgi:hypothetical protein